METQNSTQSPAQKSGAATALIILFGLLLIPWVAAVSLYCSLWYISGEVLMMFPILAFIVAVLPMGVIWTLSIAFRRSEQIRRAKKYCWIGIAIIVIGLAALGLSLFL